MDKDIFKARLAVAASELGTLLETISTQCGTDLGKAAKCCIKTLQKGGKIIFFGNGGSAAQSQHLAAELINRFRFDRRPLAALALTPDAAVTTSIGNDYDFAEIFSRQLTGLGQQGDVAIAMSTSGNSANIIAGLKEARKQGLKTIAFLGHDGGACRGLSDIVLLPPGNDTARIQELHLLLGHLLCGLIEEELCHQ
jgi:D-sedoheptulose 7-phosphate isomerase